MKSLVISQSVGFPVPVTHVAAGGVQVTKNRHICHAQFPDNVIIYNGKLVNFLISFRRRCVDSDEYEICYTYTQTSD